MKKSRLKKKKRKGNNKKTLRQVEESRCRCLPAERSVLMFSYMKDCQHKSKQIRRIKLRQQVMKRHETLNGVKHFSYFNIPHIPPPFPTFVSLTLHHQKSSYYSCKNRHSSPSFARLSVVHFSFTSWFRRCFCWWFLELGGRPVD